MLPLLTTLILLSRITASFPIVASNSSDSRQELNFNRDCEFAYRREANVRNALVSWGRAFTDEDITLAAQAANEVPIFDRYSRTHQELPMDLREGTDGVAWKLGIEPSRVIDHPAFRVHSLIGTLPTGQCMFGSASVYDGNWFMRLMSEMKGPNGFVNTYAPVGVVMPISDEASTEGVQALDATQVRLLPGSPFYERQELHRRKTLASLEPDRLLFHYRALAKLPQPKGVDAGYPGWDSGFLRGHMAGHYLSAASRMAAATSDEQYRRKVNYMVAELAKCQDALKQDGYLAAFPTNAFDHLEGKPGDYGGVVVPYYTIHKIMAGLLDAYHYLGNAQALQIDVKMADYFEKRCSSLNTEQWEQILRTDKSRNPQNEFGAMSDVLAELYEITKDKRHLMAALRFNRSWFVDPLAKGEDRLAGLHANTHIAQAVGLAHCANITGDSEERKASENFWRLATQEHSFVIGGNSFNEWFDKPGIEVGASIDKQKELPPTTAESCNTHNMLKLTARLFERKPNAEYADYYEHALYNHLLATVAPDTGAMTYFLPLRGNFRTYLNGTFCCVGSGIENTPRYNEGIYFQRGDSLWVNLYISSELDWRKAEMVFRQEGDITRGEPVRFTVIKAGKRSIDVNFRIPKWVCRPATLILNGKRQEVEGKPSTYVSLKRKWKAGDKVTLTLPALYLKQAKDDASMVSVFFGPVLLAGELGRENMPNDFADKDAYLALPAVSVPDIASSSRNPTDWLQMDQIIPLTFTVHNAGTANGITFRPLYAVHHQRYSVYWRIRKNATNVGY